MKESKKTARNYEERKWGQNYINLFIPFFPIFQSLLLPPYLSIIVSHPHSLPTASRTSLREVRESRKYKCKIDMKNRN
jgi:hypothetical protein